MPLTTVEDSGGDTMELVEFRGHLLPKFDEEVIAGMTSIPLRDDDIFINTYPKSGTHWVWEMTRLLLNGKLDKSTVEKDIAMIEAVGVEELNALPSPRILNAHVRWELLPEDVKTKKPKMIYVLRNPRDVAASYYWHCLKLPEFYSYSGKWINFLPSLFEGKFDYGSWFDYHKELEDIMDTKPDLPILILYYEDIKEDPVKQMNKVATFIGIERTQSFIQSVCDQCQFESMKMLKEPKEENRVTYRKGQVGDWKNWFTVAQSEWFDKRYNEQLKNSKLAYRYSV